MLDCYRAPIQWYVIPFYRCQYLSRGGNNQAVPPSTMILTTRPASKPPPDSTLLLRAYSKASSREAVGRYNQAYGYAVWLKYDCKRPKEGLARSKLDQTSPLYAASRGVDVVYDVECHGTESLG